jgi:hypothetical protein
MKKIKIIICLALAVAVICTGLVLAFADQENELEFCDHEYEITAFNDGVATFECTECGDTYTDAFADHINEEGYESLDVVPDGIINAKDFSYLMKNYE